MKKLKQIVMVGPDIDGLGGISRVAKIWLVNGLFLKYNIRYISTITDTPANKYFYLLKGYLSFVFSIFHGCHLVYVHTSSYNSFRRKSLFLVTAMLFGKRIVLHIHPTHFYKFLTGLMDAEKLLTFLLLHRLAGFIVLTKEMQANIQCLIPHKPVHVLRNPVHIREMANTQNHARADNRLLYLGWYIREKGVYDLVDAVEILLAKGIAVCLDFYGTKQVEALKSYVKTKKLEGAISVHGWIGDTDKLEALLKCTALVLPTYSEGIPNVILEAMATRTPIISTLVGGLKETLRDGENAIIAEAANPTDLSEKILKCLENKELRNRIAANAYREAKEQYDFPVIQAAFGRIMDEVLR